jgi:hypothetical protein
VAFVEHQTEVILSGSVACFRQWLKQLEGGRVVAALKRGNTISRRISLHGAGQNA